jgi:hypothetical protein
MKLLTRIRPDDDLAPDGVLHPPQILGHCVFIPRALRIRRRFRHRSDARVIMPRCEGVHGARIDLRGLDEPRLEVAKCHHAPLPGHSHKIIPRRRIDVRFPDVLEEEPYILPRDPSGGIRIDELEERLTSPTGRDVSVPAFLLKLRDYGRHGTRVGEAGVYEFGRFLGRVTSRLVVPLVVRLTGAGGGCHRRARGDVGGWRSASPGV